MRADNLILVALCVPAVVGAAALAWRWRALPIARAPLGVVPARDAVLDALRVLGCHLAAASIAGPLVVGLGGRLVMRVLGATSGGAQGRLTEADEVVGEITAGGTVGFIVFVGLALPVAASFAFVALRRVLPQHAAPAGAVFGLVLLGTFGVGDPLSPDNVDFVILEPRWLAVTLVALTALLYGVTFSALVARFDASPSRGIYAAFVWLVVPFFALFGAAYVGLRAIMRGRLHWKLDVRSIRYAGAAVVALLAVVTGLRVLRAASDIL